MTTEREDFEAGAKIEGYDLSQMTYNDVYTNRATESTWRGYQARGAAQQVPTGWKLVPIEATQKMLTSVDVIVGNMSWDGSQSSATESECRQIYKAMLEAVPTPPEKTP